MVTLGISQLWSSDIIRTIEKISETPAKQLELGFNSTIPDTLPTEILDLSARMGIRLNIHIPYFMTWSDQARVEQSIAVLRRGFALAANTGGIAVFHLGYYGKQKFESIQPTIVNSIRRAIDEIPTRPDGYSVGVETSGKIAEIGSLEEVLSVVSKLPKNVQPVVDWAHLFARSNGVFPRSKGDFLNVIEKIIDLNRGHHYFHGSGIEFENSQERRHLSLRSCLPPLPHLFNVLAEKKLEYTLIIESPDPLEDLSWVEEVFTHPQIWNDYADKVMSKSVLQTRLD